MNGEARRTEAMKRYESFEGSIMCNEEEESIFSLRVLGSPPLRNHFTINVATDLFRETMDAISTGIDQIMPEVQSCSDANEPVFASLTVRAKTLGDTPEEDGGGHADNTNVVFVSLGHTKG